MGKKKDKIGNLDDYGLTPRQKEFCQNYIYDWNATRAYMAAFKTDNYNVAGVESHRLLKNPKIQPYIEHLHKELEKIANISRLRVLKEYAKIAFSSMADLHDTWITRYEFDKLTPEQKASIQEISTKTRKLYSDGEEIREEEYVKLKLYDKQKALESIAKMLGYDAPLNINFMGNGSTKPIIVIGGADSVDEDTPEVQ